MSVAQDLRVPRQIKRNTLLFACAQAFAMIGSQMVPALSAIIVVQVLGAATLAGVGSSLTSVARLLISYPLGTLSDTYGRRRAIMLGVGVGLIGAMATGLAVLWGSLPLFVLSIFVFGLGIGATYQIRLAAADMYPPSRRAEGLGYVLTGSLVGALGAPLVVSLSGWLSGLVAVDVLSLTWMLLPLTIIPAILAVALVYPDPKRIAAELPRYYPGYALDSETETSTATDFSVREFLGHYPKRATLIANLAAQGNMTMMMAMTALALEHHGHALPAISLSVAIHVIGMFGLSLPLGWLADAVGRRNVMLLGLVLAVSGSMLVPSSAEYWIITAGIFLVGLGWSCVNVAGTALLVDTTGPAERGRAIGTNDTFGSIAAIILPLAAGPLVEWYGLSVLGYIALLLMAVPVVMLLRLREPRPGHYREQPALA